MTPILGTEAYTLVNAGRPFAVCSRVLFTMALLVIEENFLKIEI